MTRYEKYISIQGLAERRVKEYYTGCTFGYYSDVGKYNSKQYPNMSQKELHQFVLEKEIEWLNEPEPNN